MTGLQRKARAYVCLALAEWLAMLQTRLRSAACPKSSGVWVDQNAIATPFEQLDKNHLRNILRKMRREGQTDSDIYRRLMNVADLRGIRP